MLTDKEIAALKEYVQRLVDPVNIYLIKDICERITHAGKITATAEYKMFRAQTLGIDFKTIQKEIKKCLKISKKQMDDLFELAAKTTYKNQVKLFGGGLIAFEDNGSLQQIVRSAVELTGGKFENITRTLGMVSPTGTELPLKRFYGDTMDYVHSNVSTGAMDYNTAIRTACKSLAERGITSIGYESGVTTSLEAAVRRNIMGGLGLMVENVSTHNHDSLGANGWEMSAHAMSAKDHEPYQGRQYSDEEWTKLNGKPPKQYDPANNPEVQGMLKRRVGTLNCGHNAFPIILGVNRPQYTEEQLEKFKADNANGVTINGRHYTMYEAKQKMRQLERNIRYRKRQSMAANAAQSELLMLEAASRLTNSRRAYAEFSETAGLRTQGERLFVEDGKWKIKDHKPKLTNEEEYAINRYIGADSYSLNAKLRDGDALTAEEKQWTENLDNALEKLPIYKGDIKRTIIVDKTTQFELAEEALCGNVFFPAYTSASTIQDYHIEPNVIMNIQAQTVCDLRKLNIAEQELLYKRNSRFKVLDVKFDKGILTMKLEEICE